MFPILPAVLMLGTAAAVAVIERLGRDRNYVHPDVLAASEDTENYEDVVLDFNHPSQFNWVTEEKR